MLLQRSETPQLFIYYTDKGGHLAKALFRLMWHKKMECHYQPRQLRGEPALKLVTWSRGSKNYRNISLISGGFSLPWSLCLSLGALLFLVLIILVTQQYRWRMEHRDGLQGMLGNIEIVWRQEMGPCMTRGNPVCTYPVSFQNPSSPW